MRNAAKIIAAPCNKIPCNHSAWRKGAGKGGKWDGGDGGSLTLAPNELIFINILYLKIKAPQYPPQHPVASEVPTASALAVGAAINHLAIGRSGAVGLPTMCGIFASAMAGLVFRD